jgi:hypothetical protein
MRTDLADVMCVLEVWGGSFAKNWELALPWHGVAGLDTSRDNEPIKQRHVISVW